MHHKFGLQQVFDVLKAIVSDATKRGCPNSQLLFNKMIKTSHRRESERPKQF
jgi:hypothetical protein